jgi:hypothetical protein
MCNYHFTYAAAVRQSRGRFPWNSQILNSILCVSIIVHFTQLHDVYEKYEHRFTKASMYNVSINANISKNRQQYLHIYYAQLQVPTYVKSLKITGMNSFRLFCRLWHTEAIFAKTNWIFNELTNSTKSQKWLVADNRPQSQEETDGRTNEQGQYVNVSFIS